MKNITYKNYVYKFFILMMNPWGSKHVEDVKNWIEALIWELCISLIYVAILYQKAQRKNYKIRNRCSNPLFFWKRGNMNSVVQIIFFFSRSCVNKLSLSAKNSVGLHSKRPPCGRCTFVEFIGVWQLSCTGWNLCYVLRDRVQCHLCLIVSCMEYENPPKVWS